MDSLGGSCIYIDMIDVKPKVVISGLEESQHAQSILSA